MRVEMVFDGGRLNVLPLKEISTPTLGSPSVENGYELAGGITGGTVEVSSLETGSVDAGPLVVDPDGTSASIELVAVGPGRVLVSGKVSLASTGTSEVFGGFTHYHPPLASSADPSARTSAPGDHGRQEGVRGGVSAAGVSAWHDIGHGRRAAATATWRAEIRRWNHLRRGC